MPVAAIKSLRFALLNLWFLRPGHSALYGLITPKTHQTMVSREVDDVVRVGVEFKTSYRRFIDVAGRGENWNGVGRGKRF